MSAPQDRLRRTAAALERGELPEDAAWLAAGLRRYLSDAAHGLTLDLALGLSAAPGCEAWWTLEARARRDAAIRAVAENLEGSRNRRAALTAQELDRYATTAWRFDRRSAGMPEAYRGTRKSKLFAAMRECERTGTGGPPSARSIRRILAEPNVGHGLGVFMAKDTVDGENRTKIGGKTNDQHP